MPVVIATALILVALLVYIGNNVFHSSFVQDFTSNFLSTILGVIVGIPIALWTADYQERAAEQLRKAKILSLLREELLVNLTQLSGWQKENDDRRQREMFVLGGFLRDESWRSFSDGGELQWLRDPTLLSELSWAYGSIKTVSYLLEKYDSAGHLERGLYTAKTLSYINDMLEKGVAEACESIEKALSVIN